MFWGVQDDGLEMSIPLLNEHDPTHLYFKPIWKCHQNSQTQIDGCGYI